jgi:nitrogenase iron protein NifH
MGKSKADMRQIAFYGKGGIGKSTVVSNVSSVLAEMGRRALQIGCDPKADSSRPFWNGASPRTVVQLLRDGNGRNPEASQIVRQSASGVAYVEVGGPEPGVGCAGRGILKMFEIVEDLSLLDQGYDAVIYDVLGDVVCGGFAAPLRAGYAKEVYVVVSGEFMALYAANNICRGIAGYAEHRDVRLGGLVLNRRDVPDEDAIVAAFARKLGSQVVGGVPRSPTVARAERRRRTVVEEFPSSEQADAYRQLARSILAGPALAIPTPLPDQELEDLYFSFSVEDPPH